MHVASDHRSPHDPIAGGCCGPGRTASVAVARAMAGGLGRSGRQPLASAGSRRPGHHGDRPRAERDTVDLLVLGSIATGNPAQPLVGAMGVRDGRIVALGSADELEGLRGTDTELFEAGDRFVIPGLIEPHMHLWSTAMFYGWTDCSQRLNPTVHDVVGRLKETAARTAPGDWVCGELFDPSLYPGEPDLTAAILDEVSTEHPVAVTNASMHFIYVNSKVFEIAGITAETPDPPSGKFYRANGQLTGVVGELGGIMAIAAHLPQKTPAEIEVALRAIMDEAATKGVTSMRDALTGQLHGPAEFGMLQQLNAAQRFSTRISTAQTCMLGHQAWADAGVMPGTGDDMVRADAWKIVADGSNQGRSGYLRTPYLGGMGGNGEANFPVQQLAEYIREGHDAGWQIMMHANGDAALDLVLTAFEGVLAGAAPRDHRHRIEHSSIGHPEHFRRMAAMGVSPSFLMNHVYFWGRAFRDNIIGPERAAGLDRVNTAVANGLRVSLHSDYDVSPIHPLLAARTAVLREMRDGGEVLGPDERVDAATALRAVTSDAAWQIHADDRGTLEVGKLADFAVASADPWATEPSEWADITFDETRLGGTVAWHS
jgi:predicted amidohydrolase YtcJ